MRIVIVVALVGILASLAAALVFLLRDGGRGHRTVHALTLRIGLSVALFLFMLLAVWMGWLQPRSY
ncbi:MAG: twin transmembrane helix small protein [Burkholderiaceae bacterium]